MMAPALNHGNWNNNGNDWCNQLMMIVSMPSAMMMSVNNDSNNNDNGNDKHN